jgi:hypothetical protein
MNEIKTTTQMKFMTQNGINCMNEKIYHSDELVNLNGIVHIDGFGPHGRTRSHSLELMTHAILMIITHG